jgi:hypothetical protein
MAWPWALWPVMKRWSWGRSEILPPLSPVAAAAAGLVEEAEGLGLVVVSPIFIQFLIVHFADQKSLRDDERGAGEGQMDGWMSVWSNESVHQHPEEERNEVG